MNTFSERLKSARDDAGITQEQLAERIKKGQSLIGNLESKARSSSSYIPEIAHALGVDAYWLKTGKGERSGSSRALSKDEQVLIDAFPHLEPGVREIWLSSARAKLEALEIQKKVA